MIPPTCQWDEEQLAEHTIPSLLPAYDERLPEAKISSQWSSYNKPNIPSLWPSYDKPEAEPDNQLPSYDDIIPGVGGIGENLYSLLRDSFQASNSYYAKR